MPILISSCNHCSSTNIEEGTNMSLIAASQPWNRSSYKNYFGVMIGSNAGLSRYQMVGVSPHAHLSDGTADVVMTRHAPTIFHYLALQRRVATLKQEIVSFSTFIFLVFQ